MGCCHSRTAAPDETVDQHARAPPSEGIAASSARPNQPIRPPTPLSKTPTNVSRHAPPWTRSVYERELEIFFETRTTGSREAWATLKVVCEELRRGDIESAQTILDAANLSVPTGRVCRSRPGSDRDPVTNRRKGVRGGVYDATGRLYDLPNWVLTVPLDLVEDHSAPEKDIDDASDQDEEPSSRPSSRPEKGKGRAQSIGPQVRVRVRYNDLVPSDAYFTIGSKQTISALRQQILEARSIPTVRLILLGNLLEDHKTLEEVRWKEHMAINAFVPPEQH